MFGCAWGTRAPRGRHTGEVKGWNMEHGYILPTTRAHTDSTRVPPHVPPPGNASEKASETARETHPQAHTHTQQQRPRRILAPRPTLPEARPIRLCHVSPSCLLALPPTHHPSSSFTYPFERGDLLCQQVCLSVVILHEHIPRLLCVVIRIAPPPAPAPTPAPLCDTIRRVVC